MSRRKFPASPFSLTLTVLLATILGAGTALLDQGPAPFVTARVEAELRLEEPARMGEPLLLRVEVTNRGPGDVHAPLDGVLGLEIVSLLPHESGRSEPITLMRHAIAADVVTPTQGPFLLPAGESASALVHLPTLEELEHEEGVRIGGKLYGPAGVLVLEPLEIRFAETSGVLARGQATRSGSAPVSAGPCLLGC